MSESAQAKLDELLERLETKEDDALPQLSVTGRAVSRSDKSLHLQLPSGLVMIPLAEISGVTPSDADPLLVTVEVRRPEAVQHVATRQVSPVGAGLSQSAVMARPLVPGLGGLIGGQFGVGGVTRLPEIVLTGMNSLTSTVTFGVQADATDSDDVYSELDN